jgi:hypothetical protein
LDEIRGAKKKIPEAYWTYGDGDFFRGRQRISPNLDAERRDKEKTLETYLKYGESVFSEIDEALR